MKALVLDEREVASVALMKPMLRFVERRRPRHVTQDCIRTKHFVHRTGCIVSGRQIFEDAAYSIHCFTEFGRLLATTRIPDRSRQYLGISLVNRTVSHVIDLYNGASAASATNQSEAHVVLKPWPEEHKFRCPCRPGTSGGLPVCFYEKASIQTAVLKRLTLCSQFAVTTATIASATPRVALRFFFTS